MLSQNRNINKLVKVDYTNENNQLGKSLIFVGAKSKSIIGKAKNNDVIVTEFLQNLIKVSAKCSWNMAPKVQFHNTFLKYVCEIDPVAIHAKSETTCYLLELPKYVSNILQYTTFLRECYKILIDV